MTKDDWKHVEEQLHNFYSTVELDCDGYRVSLRLVRVDTYKNAIAVYVGGLFKGEWMLSDSEEGRRFLPERTHYLYTPTQRKSLKKIGKAMLKKINMDPDKKYTTRGQRWTSIAALRRHFEKHNQRIELVKPETKTITERAS